MNRDRLTRLVALLTRVEAEGRDFDMNFWATKECGTSACAAGWAAMDPEFQIEGFYLNRFNEPIFGKRWGFGACSEFFGLSEGETSQIFHSGGYEGDPDLITPTDVAARIRALLAADFTP